MASPTTTLCPEIIYSATPSTPNDAQISATTKVITTTKLNLSANALSVNHSKRKFSFPASFHSSTLLTAESNSNVIARTTRRLSANVSDRVSERVRKLSTAMGLGWNQSPSKEILLSQAKFLITLYVRFRIKRSVVLNQQKKKLGLQKLQRNMLGIGDVKEVFLAIKEVGNRVMISIFIVLNMSECINLHRIVNSNAYFVFLLILFHSLFSEKNGKTTTTK